jgi:hypothetical protein
MHITRRAPELSATSRRRLADDNPALEFRDRPRLLDRDGVANLLGLVFNMRVVVLGPAHGLLEQWVSEPTLNLDHKRLFLLVADDDALQNSLRHSL